MPDFLLPMLGVRYLKRHFWPRVFSRPDIAEVTVAEDDNRAIAGFIVCAPVSAAIKRLATGSPLATLPYLPAVLARHPSYLFDILAILRGERRELAPGTTINVDMTAELFSIAVTPERQGAGLGAELARAGLKRLARYPVIVRAARPDAIRFYKKLGFRGIGIEARGSISITILALQNAGSLT
ncbi:Mycothiol acetyltransferase [Oceanibacterium hippocampi]|uniref:Mycothiol acetyltransferase n=2 Tax=Oceanibacterium hippocampi TaxID=745714 RepID=A0A1Y5S1U4_9PROT|nr:Mycothiol acetyltransferase [Oceanibacterium hippocampi]